jgi:hypothetical protein
MPTTVIKAQACCSVNSGANFEFFWRVLCLLSVRTLLCETCWYFGLSLIILGRADWIKWLVWENVYFLFCARCVKSRCFGYSYVASHYINLLFLYRKQFNSGYTYILFKKQIFAWKNLIFFSRRCHNINRVKTVLSKDTTVYKSHIRDLRFSEWWRVFIVFLDVTLCSLAEEVHWHFLKECVLPPSSGLKTK